MVQQQQQQSVEALLQEVTNVPVNFSDALQVSEAKNVLQALFNLMSEKNYTDNKQLFEHAITWLNLMKTKWQQHNKLSEVSKPNTIKSYPLKS